MSKGPRELLETAPAQFAQTYASADSKTARLVLKKLIASKSAYALLIRSMVAVEIERTWPEAMKAIAFFANPYTLPYKKKWLVKMATDSELVKAIQIATVGSPDVPDEMIAILALDGSETSADALIPYFAAAALSQDRRLDVLKLLKGFPLKSPWMLSMLKTARATLDVRIAQSPAVSFANSIGVPAAPGFHFTLAISSMTPAGLGVPEIQLHLTVDSRELKWFTVTAFRLSDFKDTRFDSKTLHIDDLKLGVASPEQWPTWLARIGNVLKVKWSPDVFVSSSVRGAKREHIIQWIQSATRE
jgi:hypothetical protein